ncbi:MAG: hypothetical protein KAI66_15360 [Lentisphaeria bacterium]|nr:hypothetical protein [Lentisphaeria bacterium]
MKKSITIAVLLSIFSLYADELRITGKPPRPKILSVSTAGPTVDYLVENFQTVERMLPTDGMVLFVDVPGVRNGKPETAFRHSLFSNWKWERKWFEPSLKSLQTIKLKKLTDNFIYVAATGSTYDMFDDNAWNNVYNNIAIMSWYAKEAGLKGIFLDIEHYTKGYRPLFEYNPDGKNSFDEAWVKARQRGREFMNAMTAEYPDITMIGAFGLSTSFMALSAPDPMKYLQSSTYGLSVAFYNGIYDVMPTGARFLDGCESSGYAANGMQSFLVMSDAFFRNSPQLLSKSNQDKFLNQSGLSPGLYLDAYLNEKGFMIKSSEMNRLDLFRKNLMLALQYSQGYVWLYGEQCRWFPAKMADSWEKVVLKMPGKGRLWEEAMPGITASVEFAKDPDKAVANMRRENKLEKLFFLDFESKTADKNELAETMPAGGKKLQPLKDVFAWQSGSYTPQGTFARDLTVGYKSKSSAKLTGIKFGSIGKSIPVKPGQIYYATAVAKSGGKAKTTFAVSWKTADKRWAEEYIVKSMYTKEVEDGWKRAAAIVTVPPDIHYMIIQCGNYMPHCKVDGETICWFDNIAVYRVF